MGGNSKTSAIACFEEYLKIFSTMYCIVLKELLILQRDSEEEAVPQDCEAFINMVKADEI